VVPAVNFSRLDEVMVVLDQAPPSAGVAASGAPQ
jgi:hypothetical protein